MCVGVRAHTCTLSDADMLSAHDDNDASGHQSDPEAAGASASFVFAYTSADLHVALCRKNVCTDCTCACMDDETSVRV